MKVALPTILILLGLWTNLLGGIVSACHEEGACSTIAIEDCADVAGHGHSHERTEADECDPEPTPEDSDSEPIDHHHCVKGFVTMLALPPLRGGKIISLPVSGELPSTVAFAFPEAPVFSLEQPPQG